MVLLFFLYESDNVKVFPHQVVSLLAGGGYIERAAMRARTASGDSARSSPLPDSPPSPAASPAPDAPPLPTVKGVVEKQDSVSWVLEIEETPEEMATRSVAPALYLLSTILIITRNIPRHYVDSCCR